MTDDDDKRWIDRGYNAVWLFLVVIVGGTLDGVVVVPPLPTVNATKTRHSGKFIPLKMGHAHSPQRRSASPLSRRSVS